MQASRQRAEELQARKSELRKWRQEEENRRRTERLQGAQERRAALAALGLSRFGVGASETQPPVQAPAAGSSQPPNQRPRPPAPEPAPDSQSAPASNQAAESQTAQEPQPRPAEVLVAAPQPVLAATTPAPVLPSVGAPRTAVARAAERSVQLWREAFPESPAEADPVRPGAVHVGLGPAPAGRSERSTAVTSPGGPPPLAPTAPLPWLDGEELVLPSRGSPAHAAPSAPAHAAQPPGRSASAQPEPSAAPRDRPAPRPAREPEQEPEEADDEDVELHFIAREPLRRSPG